LLHKKLLPEQIPSLVSISKLPVLTVSQKIDKQALIARVDTPDEYLLSTTCLSANAIDRLDDPIIAKLRSFWETLLCHNNFDNHTDFEFLGGASNDRARLVEMIKREINPKFTMLDLLRLNQKSIGSLYEFLTKNKEIEKGQPMAIISPLVDVIDPKKNNLYILPHILGSGDRWSYSTLAENIIENRNDVNVWGLSDPGLYDESLIDKSHDQLIDQCNHC
jgi:hypothetical protein